MKDKNLIGVSPNGNAIYADKVNPQVWTQPDTVTTTDGQSLGKLTHHVIGVSPNGNAIIEWFDANRVQLS